MNLIGGREIVTLLNLFEKICQEENFRILYLAISSSKGHLNSEWIYEVIVYPKMQN